MAVATMESSASSMPAVEQVAPLCHEVRAMPSRSATSTMRRPFASSFTASWFCRNTPMIFSVRRGSSFNVSISGAIDVERGIQLAQDLLLAASQGASWSDEHRGETR